MSSTDSVPAVAEGTDFAREIRPILSDKCFQCHGPDVQKSGLRLDDAEAARASGVFVPGDPGASKLVQKITADLPEDRMPPPQSKLSLTTQEITKLRDWIAAGGEYRKHWAFEPVPPAQAPTPVGDTEWARNPIDAFILDALRESGLEPSAQADPETLLRRVTLDLTGLPPTIEEMDAYLAADVDTCYEAAVDRLLADPGYGERMAMDWLDVARYADTHGYQDDKENGAWPWREWVIRAFNADLPYDDFIRQQTAGDLLPDPTQDQVLATAFNRIHRQTNEGGVVEEEFLVEYAADRTQTFGTAFLGLTLECARCHDHKFDPISQEEYYQLFAFFNNIDESGMYSHFTDNTPTPNMFLHGPGQQEKHRTLRGAIADAECALDDARKTAPLRFEAWRSGETAGVTPPAPVVHLPLDGIEKNKTANAAPEGKPAKASSELKETEGVVEGAVLFNGDSSIELDGGPLFERYDPFTVSLWLRAPEKKGMVVVCHQSKATLDAASCGWEIYLQDGHVVFGLAHFWPGNAVRVRSKVALVPEKWTYLAITYDGSSRARGIALYADQIPMEFDVVRDNLCGAILYEREGVQPPITLGARFRDSGLKGGAIDEFKVFDARLSAAEVAALCRVETDKEAQTEMSEPPSEALLDYYIERVDSACADARAALHDARKAEQDFVATLREVMVMREEPRDPHAYVLARGAYDARGERVEPGTPARILPFPDDYPKNRLGLAEWLLRRDNPLTARVAVNRYWKLFFGKGLVETQENFGSQGTPPSHPELLDFLAAWFIDRGWDVKALCRLIVTSATYRQDSRPTPELVALDPDNRLLARGPRQRMEAERIRDAALAACGLLVDTIGGPSVKPYQPDGLWEDASKVGYQRDSGDALYRRSMYTFWKRTVHPPSMATFDAGNREVCVARREVTTTPLQALVLLNNPQFVEAARVLGAELTARHAEPAARLDAAFRRLLGRRPTDAQMTVLLAMYQEQVEHFASSADAHAYLGVGEWEQNEEADPAEAAATTAIIQAIMCLDEFQVNV